MDAHFIPNTHLDREWTLDFQHTRKMTVDFMDALLEIQEQVADYHFLLDGQAVPLLDYLEVRPQNREILKQRIQEGRLNAGPWFSALDMNCISGESIVRNMLFGHRTVEEFGPVMKVGYTPFGWGQCSQFPQIYQGFGIDVCFFYRGITAEQAPEAEFTWRGPDGSQVLCSRFGSGARYNFYFGVWRKALYQDMPHRLNRRLCWQEDSAPFKLCDAPHRFRHGYVLREKRTLDGKTARAAYRALMEEEASHFPRGQVACMHGMDTSTPDLREMEVVKACQQDLESGERFFLSSLPRYAEAVREACGDLDMLPRLEAEPRHVKMNELGFSWIANDMLSARSRQKVMLFDTENQLTRVAEPFAVLARIHGTPIPGPFLDEAWKQVLKCHPHDTVGGCGIDRIEEDAGARMRDAQSLAQMVTSESLMAVQQCIDTSGFPEDALVLTVYNSSAYLRSEVVEAFVDLPREWVKPIEAGEAGEEVRWPGFVLQDAEGRRIPHALKRTPYRNKVFRDHADLALMSFTDEFRLQFEVTDVPALGYATYALCLDDTPAPEAASAPEEFRMENAHLVAEVQPNGTVDLLDVASGQHYPGLNWFEDRGEVGHAWTHLEPGTDHVVDSRIGIAERVWAEATPLVQSIRVRVPLQVPVSLTRARDRMDWRKTVRPEEPSREMMLDVTYTLRAGARSLEVQVRFDNTCTHHRLRAMFPTGVETDVSFAESPFDVVHRRIPRDAENPYAYMPHLTYPLLRFCGVESVDRAFTCLSGGLKEYEVLDTPERTLALTLMRAYENNLCTAGDFDLEHQPGSLSQSPGAHDLSYRIYPGAVGRGLSRVFREADRMTAPLAVAETKARAGIGLPSAGGFLSIEDERVQLSGLTGEARGERIVLRVFNPTDSDVETQVTCGFPIVRATLTNLNEEDDSPCPVNARGIRLTVPARKIVTVALDPGCGGQQA